MQGLPGGLQEDEPSRDLAESLEDKGRATRDMPLTSIIIHSSFLKSICDRISRCGDHQKGENPLYNFRTEKTIAPLIT